VTPLKSVRLLYLPAVLAGLYLLVRLLVPGPAGVGLAVGLVAAGAYWGVRTYRRSCREAHGAPGTGSRR
jgi:hypothetical protein